MSEHILLRLAKRKPYSQIPEMPIGCDFNRKKGIWMKDGEALISHDSEFGVQATKKCDVETGEDQKGE